MTPILLAVTPLPRPLTTPPDTSTYFMSAAEPGTFEADAVTAQESHIAIDCATLALLRQLAVSQSTAALRLNDGDDRIPTAIAFLRSSALA